MKRTILTLALAGLFAAPAAAQSVAGISGSVIDVGNGQPIANATILYYKAPYLENGPNQIYTMKSDRHGHFADITLEPGRYIVVARVPNRVVGCAVDDVSQGEVTRIKLEIGHDRIVCVGPRVHPTLVDPNLTADLYRI